MWSKGENPSDRSSPPESDPTRLKPRNGFTWPSGALEFPYSFKLFGRFQAWTENGVWTELDSRRLQQIIAYLLLFRDRPHHRDILSSTLWTDSSAEQSRKNLRQSLWHLQKIQQRPPGDTGGLLLTDKDWVQLNPSVVWLDVAELEGAYAPVRAVPAEEIGHRAAEDAMKAAGMQTGRPTGRLGRGLVCPRAGANQDRLPGTTGEAGGLLRNPQPFGRRAEVRHHVAETRPGP